MVDTSARFAVTVDVVVLTIRDHRLCAAVVCRGATPFEGYLGLPGGFVRADEDLRSAAVRVLKEETGVGVESVYLEQLASDGEPPGPGGGGRPPRTPGGPTGCRSRTWGPTAVRWPSTTGRSCTTAWNG